MINVLGKTYILAARLESRSVRYESKSSGLAKVNFKAEKLRAQKKVNWKFKSRSLMKFFGVSSECPCH
ncbi:hypothetical protein [Kiloniella sp.]|uniref:hypothetical protein n=1 Tax=Kiloniella sp. TaxID=1938587 RepID=UPI003A93AE2A